MNSKFSQYDYIFFLLICTILFVNIAVFFNVVGFLSGHEGHAGPHFISVSINNAINPIGLLYEESFTIDGINNVSSYNHHPKFISYLYSFLISNINDLHLILPYLYSFTVLVNVIGFICFYTLMSHITDKYYALICVISLMSVINVVMFINLTTYDAFSLISFTAFLYIIRSLSNRLTRLSTCRILILLFILFNISWYNIFIIFSIYITFLIYALIGKYDIKNQDIKLYIILILAPILFFLVFYFNSFININLEYSYINGLGAKNFIDNKNNYSLLDNSKLLLLYIFRSVPIFLIILIIFLKNYEKKFTIEKYYFLPFLIFIFSFHLIDFKWNLIHNFVSLYIAPLIIVYISQYLKILHYRKIILLSSIIVFFYVNYNMISKDLISLNSTSYYLEYISSNKNANVDKLLVSNEILITNLEESKIPKNLNKGSLFYLKAIQKNFLNKSDRDNSYTLHIDKNKNIYLK